MKTQGTKKYELTDETVTINDKVLYRIRALIDIPEPNIKAGDLGGFVETENNLSHEGDCWVHMGACAHDNATVCDNAQIRDNAEISGNALICDNAMVCGTSLVKGDTQVYGRAQVSGNASVSGEAVVCGEAIVAENATVCEQAVVSEEAIVSGEARVSGNACISGNTWIRGNAYIHDIGCNGRDNSFEVANGSIYVLPCTFTGLDAELDNCDPPADVQCVSDLGDPIPAGYTRYVTADGIFLDCSLDETDFADWFGKELAEWSV